MANKPLISTEDDIPESKNSGGGCSGCFVIIGIIFIIMICIKACSKDESSTGETYREQTKYEETIDKSTSLDTDSLTPQTKIVENTSTELSPEAASLEKMLFHRLYTDLGTVEIYNFPERADVLEFLATYCTDRDLFNTGQPVKRQKTFSGKTYYYCTSEETNLYYIGDTKDNGPDGFGAVVGIANSDGTYELQGEGLIYCAGNFKDGMLDGYGVLFAANEDDISYAIQDVIAIMQEYNLNISDDTGEKIVNYLFDYVSYEGYFKENEKNGEGNNFEFYYYDDTIRFYDLLNPPIDNYLFGPVYPNVTMGEYKDGKLDGHVKIYKSNRIIYDGEMKNGVENGSGISYYDNGQIEYEGEFKNGRPNGYGTSYDYDGSMIYSGEWKYGDYAH